MIKFFLIIFVFVNYLYSDYKSINDDILLYPDKQAIINTVLNVDGYINEDLYNEFWKDLRKTTTQKQVEDLKKYFVLNIKDIQIVIWNCIKKSIKKKKVCKSKKLDNILAKMKQDKNFIAYNNTVEILEASATGKPFSLRGQNIIMTEDIANHTLNGLNSSMQRIQILLSNKWTGN